MEAAQSADIALACLAKEAVAARKLADEALDEAAARAREVSKVELDYKCLQKDLVLAQADLSMHLEQWKVPRNT